MSVVIDVENLSKAYPIYNRPVDVIKDLIFGSRRANLFWALRDLNFQIHQGQRVGIIGANGSGKTTLLRILTGNLAPTSGRVDVHGRISAMLSLASALSLDDSGYNNIKYNLLLNGCDPKKIPSLVDEIIEFTQLGPFIYSPVRTYSAGMNAKLAFAITTAMEPDLLVVDEVLSVGDAFFVGKAMKRMADLADRGRALIFVSHSTDAVLKMCDYCIWMDDGEIRQMGPATEVVREYEENWRKQEDFLLRSETAKRLRSESLCLFPEDFKISDAMKVRLVNDSEGEDFEDTFYIESIEVVTKQSSITKVDLRDVNLQSSCFADLREGQWGRLFALRGVETRLLSAHAGRQKGGILWLKNFREAEEIKIRVRWKSLLNKEKLALQIPSLETKSWRTVAGTETVSKLPEWHLSEFAFPFQKLSVEQFQRECDDTDAVFRNPVEIVNAGILVGDRSIHVVSELQGFEIEIEVEVHKVVENFDVGLKLTKEDGSYVFFMSSGEVGANFQRADLGRHKFRFKFDPNPFGAGEYLISTFIGSGWDPVHNYPYSDVYDRKLTWSKLCVKRKDPAIDYGVVNVKVPVRIVSPGPKERVGVNPLP